MYQVSINQFQGPMDLLLSLVESAELEINQISLAMICDQYVDYIEKNKAQITADELAEFLVVASRLLILKTRTLWPYLLVEEEIDETSLETQLKMYKLFHEAALELAKQDRGLAWTFGRVAPTWRREPTFRPDSKITLANLSPTYLQVISRLPFIRLPETILKRNFNLQHYISRLRGRLRKVSHLSFSQLLPNSATRYDQLVSFLALLELARRQEVKLEQTVLFEEIVVTIM